MIKHKLECGCTFENEDDNWIPCKAHINSKLYKVRKAHAEVVNNEEIDEEIEEEIEEELEMENCSNCHRRKDKGSTCRQCGVGPRIG